MAVPFLLSWLRLATSSSARFGAASPYLFVRKIPYVIAESHPLKPVGPAIEKRTVTPRRPRNAEVRTREDLTVAELERLGQRDAMMILVASRHGQRNELGQGVVKWGRRN
jgi:hypothetical protein